VKRYRLKDTEIETAYRELLAVERRRPTVSVATLRGELLRKYGTKGRTERLLRCVQAVRKERDALPAVVADPDRELKDLRERAEQAERRAVHAEQALALSEERVVKAEARERGNQDFFANRYAEQLVRLQAERTRESPKGIPVEVYLRIYRRAVYYRNRLSLYENVEELSEVDKLDGLGPRES
jgi:hypothetical protein